MDLGSREPRARTDEVLQVGYCLKGHYSVPFHFILPLGDGALTQLAVMLELLMQQSGTASLPALAAQEHTRTLWQWVVVVDVGADGTFVLLQPTLLSLHVQLPVSREERNESKTKVQQQETTKKWRWNTRIP